MENLAIQKSSWQRPPYLIDPDMEGVRWLRRMIYQHRLVNIDMQTRFDPSMVVRIEKAILGGRPLLMMNSVDCVDSMSAPLIHHANHGTEEGGSGDARLIKYCGRRLLGHEHFRVTLATTNMYPNLSARTASATTLVNYNASPEMLREELLDRAFARVMPMLYLEKKKVLKAIQQHKETLQFLEDKLLQVLEGEVSSQEITSHTEYVSSIVDHKEAVFARLEAAEQALSQLERIRDQLSPVSKRGAMLYSVVQSLQGMQREYRVSLPMFHWMFDQAVGEELPPEVAQEEDWNDAGTGSDDEDDPHQGKVVPPPRLGSASTRISEKKVAPGDGGEGQEQAGAESGLEEDEDDAEGTAGVSVPDIVIPDVPSFPTNGMEYTNLSANQVKQLVDCLTQTVFQNVRQSLYDEHRLLFATLLCINIQYETTNIFTEEELALLLQGRLPSTKRSTILNDLCNLHSQTRIKAGNPGLGTMELTLLDFGCDAPPPAFLPPDKWEDILAISVLPGALDSLCIQMAENPDRWDEWYQSSEPERLALPLRPATGEERPVDEHGQTSPQSSPDLGNLNEFHQLILLRLLRPDRFPAAASRYVQRHLTCVKPLPSALGSILGSASRSLAVMVLMPPSPAGGNKRLPSELKASVRPVEILQTYAQKKSIPYERIAINEGTEQQVAMAIDAIADKDGWLVIEDLHLASNLFLSNLKGQLIRVGNTGGPLGLNPIAADSQSRFCIWLTSEPSGRLPDDLLQSVRIVSWDVIGPHLLHEQDGSVNMEVVSLSQDDILKTATIAALKAVDPSTWQALADQSTALRGVAYGACVIHAVLYARQTYGARGLSQYQAFCKVQVNHTLEVILGSRFKEEGGQAGSDSLAELCSLISEVVYGNMLTDPWDNLYLSAIVNHILTATSRSGSQLVLGSITVPTPPANVDATDYAGWLEEKWDEEIGTTESLSLDDGVKKLVNKASGLDFLTYLDNLYEIQHSGPKGSSVPAQPQFNSTKISNAIDSITERLPSIVDLGELPIHIVNEAEKYTFPYHAPSLMSLLSVASVEMPQSIGFVLLQECHWYNSLLCHVRQSLHEVECCMLQGQYAMKPAIRHLAMALQQDAVPASWVHPNRQPSGHTLVSWVSDLKRRHDQMQAWIKEGKVPRSAPDTLPVQTEPRGHLLSIWMGGLVNPTAVITSLRQEKAALTGCLMSEVGISCEVSKSLHEDSFDIVHPGGMYIRDIYLDGATWNLEYGCLAPASSTLSAMPSMYIRPVLLNEEPETARSSESNADQTSQQEPSTEAGENVDNEKQRPQLGVYNCPVFLNQSRQVCVFSLDLACPLPVEQWTMAGTALILDPEAPENGARKWPQPSMQHSVRTIEEVAAKQSEEGTSERGPPSQASRRSMGSKPDSATGLRVGSGSRHSAMSRPSNSRQSVRSDKKVTIEEKDEEEEKKQDVVLEEEEEEEQEQHGNDAFELEEDVELMLTARSQEQDRRRHLRSTFDYRNLADALNENKNADPDERDELDHENADDAGGEADYEDDYDGASERSSTRSSRHSSRASSASAKDEDVRKYSDEEEKDRKYSDDEAEEEKEPKKDEEDFFDTASKKSAQSRHSTRSQRSTSSDQKKRSDHEARNSPYGSLNGSRQSVKPKEDATGSRTSLQSKKSSKKDDDTASRKSFKAAEDVYALEKGSRRTGSGGSRKSLPKTSKDRASSAESNRSEGRGTPDGNNSTHHSKELQPRPPSSGSRKSGRPGSGNSRRSLRSAGSVKSDRSEDEERDKFPSNGEVSEDKKEHHGSKESLNFFEQAIEAIRGDGSSEDEGKTRSRDVKSAASHGRVSSQGRASRGQPASRASDQRSVFNKDDPNY